eukprot:scaffold410348_cov47-Attheya_sp.AAC.2
MSRLFVASRKTLASPLFVVAHYVCVAYGVGVFQCVPVCSSVVQQCVPVWSVYDARSNLVLKL